MKAIKISYERLFSMPGYNNKKVGVEYEVEEGENIEVVLQSAIDFVNKQYPEVIEKLEREKENTEFNKQANILANVDKYEYSLVAKAAEFVLKKMKNDLPF